MFLHPFDLASFNETLPAGEYEVETELHEPLVRPNPDNWTASVLVHLKPRATHPGLNRTLSVPLVEFERVCARDKLTGKALKDVFLEEMLSDPMIQQIMQADGVSEDELRALYSGRSEEDPRQDGFDPIAATRGDPETGT